MTHDALLTREATEAPDTREALLPNLLLQSGQHELLAHGTAPVIAPAVADLGLSAARYFSERPQLAPAGPAVLAGALPFDRAQSAHLLAVHQQWPAAQQSRLLDTLAAASPEPQPWSITPQPTRARYEEAVREALKQLHSGGSLQKLVLARTLRAHASQPVNPWRLLKALAADSAVMRYVMPLPVGAGEAPAWLVGATPELLLSRRGANIVSEPLAGSAPRLPDASASQAQADALRASAKDQQEHRFVVQAIADLLTPLCRELRVPAQPALYATASMWHLGTRIEGVLKDPAPEALPVNASVALAALLHPTPAVCGTPREPAAALIQSLESVPRDFYAGAVGWCDARGDGDWHVALRCARVQGHEARLFAGAGIVAGSVPASEGAETRAKFNAMLHALGVDERALPADL